MDPQLFALGRDFFALVPINKLKFPEKISLSQLNSFFMNHILFDGHFQKYSPSNQYQIGFWKWAIQHLEEIARHISEEEEVGFIFQDMRIRSASWTPQLIYDRKMKLPRRYTSIMSVLYRSLSGKPYFFPDTPSKLNRRTASGVMPPSPSYVTYFWLPDESASLNVKKEAHDHFTATLLESRTMIESGTTGLRTWLASFHLARYLIQNPGTL
jgi:hypothetical protein